MKKRNTKQREVILDILRRTKSHPTADWIYEQARKRLPHISLGTVYRNLKLLKELGEIIELDYGSTFTRYDGNPNNHYHFVCESCGRIYDLDEPIHPELEERVALRTGFRVDYHRLEFYGSCAECTMESSLTKGG